ncbi:MAG TPA: inositol monophosphatase [Dehalococcoidia bacterium]|nr:inositol monophosphatase [Dehalococcoidia bacterium]
MTALPLSTSGKEALEVATAAAREAGEILKARFRAERHVQYKGRANIVTDVDLQVEKSLRAFIQAEYPDHNIVSEESEPVVGASDYTWIFDPLDGTNNYSFGIPFFATVTALTRGEDVLLGIVYDPLRDEMFCAVKGEGTTLNGRPVSVTGKTAVRNSLIGLDLGYVDDKGKKLLEFISSLWPNIYAFRIMGSAALGMSYAACGLLDLYFHALVYPWEIAAGKLLVTEASGVITDWEGRPVGVEESSIIASNQAVHADFLRLLQATNR